jgi:hypothetical protein
MILSIHLRLAPNTISHNRVPVQFKCSGSNHRKGHSCLSPQHKELASISQYSQSYARFSLSMHIISMRCDNLHLDYALDIHL